MVQKNFAPASNFDGYSFWQSTETTCPTFSSSSHTRCCHCQGAIRQDLDVPFSELGKAISAQCLHAGNCDSNPKAYHLKHHWNNLVVYLWVIFGMTQNFGNLWHTYSAPNVWGGVTCIWEMFGNSSSCSWLTDSSFMFFPFAGFQRNGSQPCMHSGMSTNKRPPVNLCFLNLYDILIFLSCLHPPQIYSILFAGPLHSRSLRRDQHGPEPCWERWKWFVATIVLFQLDSIRTPELQLPTAVP